jgi:hypothetical protein
MALSASEETRRFDDRLKRLAEENENQLNSWDGPVILPLAAFCISAASTSPLSIEKIIGNPDLPQVLPTIEVTIDKQRRLDFPWGRNQRRARPIVRGERRTYDLENYALFEQLFRNGDANFAHMRKYTRSDDHHAYRFYIGWIFNLLAVALLSIDKLRLAGGVAEMEYALDMVINVRGEVLLGFTDNDEWQDLVYKLPPGVHKLPRCAIGPRDQFPNVCLLIMEDILHLVGCSRSFDWKLALPEA